MSEGSLTKSSKHIVCRNVFKHGKCPRGDECSFAHNIDELVDIECKFSRLNKCKKGRLCKFKHVNETREMYHIRVGITFTKRRYVPVKKVEEKTVGLISENIYDSLLEDDSDDE